MKSLHHLVMEIREAEFRVGKHAYYQALHPDEHDAEAHARDEGRLFSLLRQARELIDLRLAALPAPEVPKKTAGFISPSIHA